MNPNKRQTAAIGVFLIALGLVMWLHLWWLVWPGALVAGGVLAYRERRRMGQPVQAVQAALWCFGFALLALTHFWLGVIFLAGVSLLLRGRELAVDATVQQALSQARSRRAAPRPITTQQVPITTQPAPAAPQPPAAPAATEYEAPITGDTTRLRG
jgi:hypothetical protein